jgi:lysophospholipase L1-like esterase
MNKLYNELSNTYGTFVRFVQTSAMVNKETSHPLTDIAVDDYTTIQGARSRDYVHLDEKGYKQYGDAVYRGLCGLFDMKSTN